MNNIIYYRLIPSCPPPPILCCRRWRPHLDALELTSKHPPHIARLYRHLSSAFAAGTHAICNRPLSYPLLDLLPKIVVLYRYRACPVGNNVKGDS